jgi:hypothetical protein
VTTIRFDALRAKATRKVVCPGCSKQRTISRTFEQTVNPWHKNPDGTVKTAEEVRRSVRAEADAWEPCEVDCWHQRCWNDAPEGERP